MILFNSIPWYSVLMWFVVIGILMAADELVRRNKYVAFFCFIVLPLILPFTVWKYTASTGTSVGDWFHWAKTYSAILACLCIMSLRSSKSLRENKYYLIVPAIILAGNIAEAVISDFQCFSLNGLINGITIIGGPWNIMNGIAGILNILTISGFTGIIISRNKTKDMLWPDQLWFWIAAYTMWNFAYLYNCASDHSFYSGGALLLSSIIPALVGKKGSWIQHRAHTLAFFIMFIMTFPSFFDTSIFAVKSSHNKTALFLVSLISLVINLLVFIYHFYKVFKYKRNPLTGEVHHDLKAHKKIVDDV